MLLFDCAQYIGSFRVHPPEGLTGRALHSAIGGFIGEVLRNINPKVCEYCNIQKIPWMLWACEPQNNMHDPVATVPIARMFDKDYILSSCDHGVLCWVDKL